MEKKEWKRERERGVEKVEKVEGNSVLRAPLPFLCNLPQFPFVLKRYKNSLYFFFSFLIFYPPFLFIRPFKSRMHCIHPGEIAIFYGRLVSITPFESSKKLIRKIMSFFRDHSNFLKFKKNYS